MTTNINTIQRVDASRCVAFLFTLIAASSLLAGCGGAGGSNVAKEKSHLRILGRTYIGYITNKGRRPADEAEFKAYVQESMGPPVLERYGINSVEELYVSERDGQPLVFLYGKQPQGDDDDVVGYEKTGVDGKRWVSFRLGNIEEVDETRFRELIPNAP